jgi:hypothetical protein
MVGGWYRELLKVFDAKLRWFRDVCSNGRWYIARVYYLTESISSARLLHITTTGHILLLEVQQAAEEDCDSRRGKNRQSKPTDSVRQVLVHVVHAEVAPKRCVEDAKLQIAK